MEIRRKNFVQAGPVPVPDAGGGALRHRQLPCDDGQAGGDVRPRRLRGAAGGEQRRGASCAAMASRPTSRPAASRRRASSARSGRGPGSTRARRSRVNPTGGISVFTGSHSHGQGHETTFAQVVSRDDRHRLRADRHRARRHGADPLRHGHLWLALAGGRRVGDRAGDREDHREGEEDRGAPDGGVRHRRRVQGRPLHRRGHRQVGGLDRRDAGGLRAAQVPDRGAGAGAGGDVVLRPGELHLPGRRLWLRGRGRSRHRQGRGGRASRRPTTSATW